MAPCSSSAARAAGGGVGAVLDRLRCERRKLSKRAHHQNTTQCSLLMLLAQYPDITHNHLLAPHNLTHMGLVTLWRLRATSRQWNAWVGDAMRSLPAMIVQGVGTSQDDDAAGPGLFALSFSQMRWTALPHVQGRQFHAACSTVAGDVVLAGGTVKAELPGDHPLGSRIGADTRSVDVYCGGTWRRSTAATELPAHTRRACMLCLRDGSLLAIGGLGEEGVARADIWRLQPDGRSGERSSSHYESRGATTGAGSDSAGSQPSTSSAWEPRRPMHVARSDFACGVLPDGRVVVAGGLGNAPDYLDPTKTRQVMLRSAEVYDPVLDRWSCLPHMRYPRSACRGCVDRFGRFIVSGGRGVQEGPLTVPLDCVECFVPAGRSPDEGTTPAAPGLGAESGAEGLAKQQLGRWIEYGSLRCSSVEAGGAPLPPPPLCSRSVGHSMLCIAGDLVVIGPAFASSMGGGGSARGGVGAGISSGGGFGAMILMGSDHCPGRPPRWRRLRLPIPCRGRQCTAVSAGGLSSSVGGTSPHGCLREKRQRSVLPALTHAEVEQAWAALTRMRAVKLCVELLTLNHCQHQVCQNSRMNGPLVAFSAMLSDQGSDTEGQLPALDLQSPPDASTGPGGEAYAALFRAPLLSRTGLLQGLRSAGAAASLVRWSIPRSCLPDCVPLPPTSASWSEATKECEVQLERRFCSLVDCLMHVLDVDGDGKLSLAEFCRLDELLRRCGSQHELD